MQDEGGISEEDAVRLGRVAADALVIIRFLADENRGLAVSLHSLNGKTHEALSIEAQFTAWLAFTGYLAREATGEDHQKRRHFLRHVLGILALDERLGVIQPASSEDPESRYSQSDAPASTSG